MVKRTIVWTRRAEEELISVLKYYNQRNQSNKYSLKILSDIERKSNLLISYPEIGRIADNKKSRVIVFEYFLLFYEVLQTSIVVLSFWDSRQDPDKRIDSN